MNCPNCGAPLPDPAGRPTVVCDHCGSVIAFKLPSAAPNEQAAPAAPEPRYEYGPTPTQRPVRSDLTSVALGPADAAHVIQLLRDGQELEAIQFYQSKVGGSLGEAKDAIRAIQEGLRDAAAPTAPGMPGGVPDPGSFPEVLRLAMVGNTIAAIRAYRLETRLGLREAKDAVEALERQLRQGNVVRQGAAPVFAPSRSAQPAPARSGNRSCLGGCGGVVAVGVVILLVIVGILYRRSDYVQKTTIYKCSLPEIKTALSSQALLIAPISGGYPVLVPRYKPAGDTSNWTFNAEYYAPIWGANGWGIVDVHLADDSSGNNSVSARLYQDGRWRPVLPAGQIQCRL